MKKYIFGILIFFILISQVYALEVNDIATQIQTSTQENAKNNAELLTQVSTLKTSITTLNAEIVSLRETSVQKSDLPIIYDNINQLNHQAVAQQLAMLIVVATLAFTFAFICKARGWL